MKKYVPLAEAKQLFEKLTGAKSWLNYRQRAAENGFQWKPADSYSEGNIKFYQVSAIERFAAFLIENNLIGRNTKTK